MNATFNSQAKAISIFSNDGTKWSALDLLILTTLAMYVYASVMPHSSGYCSQRLSANTVVSSTASVPA